MLFRSPHLPKRKSPFVSSPNMCPFPSVLSLSTRGEAPASRPVLPVSGDGPAGCRSYGGSFVQGLRRLKIWRPSAPQRPTSSAQSRKIAPLRCAPHTPASSQDGPAGRRYDGRAFDVHGSQLHHPGPPLQGRRGHCFLQADRAENQMEEKMCVAFIREN